jgi:hypothetical protein
VRLARRAVALAALTLAAQPAWADYKDTYKQGVEAAEKGRWADVARLMQQSIDGNAAAFVPSRASALGRPLKARPLCLNRCPEKAQAQAR